MAQVSAAEGSPLVTDGGGFLLMYFADHGSKQALMPVGVFPDADGAARAREQLQNVAGLSDKYGSVIAPLGKWGAIDADTDVLAVLRGALTAAHKAQRERVAAGRDASGLSEGARAVLAEAAAQHKAKKMATITEMPEDDKVLELKAVHVADRAAEEAPTAAEADVKVQTPPEPATPAGEWETVVHSRIKKGEAKRKAAKLKAKAPEKPVYKPGQQEAFNGLTARQRMDLRKTILHAQRTGNNDILRDINKRFGPIMVVGDPEVRAQPAPASK